MYCFGESKSVVCSVIYRCVSKSCLPDSFCHCIVSTKALPWITYVVDSSFSFWRAEPGFRDTSGLQPCTEATLKIMIGGSDQDYTCLRVIDLDFFYAVMDEWTRVLTFICWHVLFKEDSSLQCFVIDVIAIWMGCKSDVLI